MFIQTTKSRLLPQIASVDNLTLAWQQVRRNIRVSQRGHSKGPDNQTIAAFEADWVNQMGTLAEELRTGQYHPLPPRRLIIQKPHGGERVIGILAVRDRVAQRAVHQVLEPLFNTTFAESSYGCRPHVGAPHALAQVERYRQRGKIWAVHSDITDFFDSIDHRILLGLLRLRLHDRAVVDLIAAWLHAGVLSEHSDGDANPWWQQGLPAPTPPPVGWNTVAGSSWTAPAAGPGITGNYAPQPAWMSEELGPIGPQFSLRQQIMREAIDRLINSALHRVPLGLGLLRHATRHRRLVGVAGLGLLGSAAVPLIVRALRQEIGRGTIQGGALSPLLANVYLDPFDRALTRQGYTFVRYLDDFVILGENQAEVEAALVEARRQATRLRLGLNNAKTAVCGPGQEMTFLGHRFAPLAPPVGPQWTSFEEARQVATRQGRQVVQRFRQRDGK